MKALKFNNTEVAGSTFRGRNLKFNIDITDSNFYLNVKDVFGVLIERIDYSFKNSENVSFELTSIEFLKQDQYTIEYWAEFDVLGTEMIALERFVVVNHPYENLEDKTLNFILNTDDIDIEFEINVNVINIGGSGGDFIPMSGTNYNNPVSGDINTIGSIYILGDKSLDIYYQDGLNQSEHTSGVYATQIVQNHYANDITKYAAISGQLGIYHVTQTNSDVFNITIDSNVGITATHDYSENYDDKSFVQYKWVLDRISETNLENVVSNGNVLRTPIVIDLESEMYNGFIADDGAFSSYNGINNASRPSQYIRYLNYENYSVLDRNNLVVGSNSPSFTGIEGFDYYGDRATDNTYIQKKYVDTQKVKYITSDVTLDHTYNNALCFVSADCVISVPNNLPLGFSCEFDVIGMYTPELQSSINFPVTFSAPLGKVMDVNSQCRLTRMTGNEFRFTGKLSFV